MENFVVSARKYRPVTFDLVVGQSSITSTLKSAILNNHLAQAFLFTGPRGVGKTTCARIFAKTINCEHLNEKMEPCDQCESCVSFNRSNSFNIHELDAASNNSVEDIRRLVDQVRIPPQLGKYKVYIIDEVHMLSQAAFNAFLKTLEEPPAYAKFILATTEKHKIIPTILSRCQIYDFQRITLNDIAEHLAFVAQNEGVKIEEKALMVMAQKADGAMRDALSIFDQIVSYAGNEVTYAATIENLNVLDEEYYFRIVNFILQGDISSTLLVYNEIVSKGFDGLNFINGLASHLRNLLVSKDPATISLLETSELSKKGYAQQSTQCNLRFLVFAIDLCSVVDTSYKNATDKRLLIELHLMKMCKLNNPFETISESTNEKKKSDESPSVAPIEKPYPTSPSQGEHISNTNEKVSSFPANAISAPKSESEVISTPAATAFKIVKTEGPRGFSLKNETSIDTSKANSNEVEDSLNQRFSSVDKQLDESRMRAALTEFVDSIRVEKRVFASSIDVDSCTIGENNALTLVFSNQSSSENNEIIAELLSYLKENLGTAEIQLVGKKIKEIKFEASETSMDVYKRLVLENGVLEEMRKQLDLELL